MSKEAPRNPMIPCMFDREKWCVNCKLYTINFTSLRRMAQMRSVKNILNREGVDRPLYSHIADLIRGYDRPLGSVESDALGGMRMLISNSKPMQELGKALDNARKMHVIESSSDANTIPLCPVYRGEFNTSGEA